MAIAHLHTAIVQRSAGQSAVGAAAYAARARMIDERTGQIHDYSRKSNDVLFSFVGLPKDAPEHLRDPISLANAMEARENRKNSQTARKFTMALPHELTDEQREWLVKDFGRENFTRKGLAYHVAIHRPHAYGDQRNIHAHWVVSTRVVDASGFTAKDRESNEKAALMAWRDAWEKLINRHLERHRHDARISMKSLEAQGIDRTPQIHLGQGASALERKGNATDRGELLRGITNDNDRVRPVGKEFDYAAGKPFARDIISPPSRPRPVIVQQPQDWTAGKLFARDDIGLPHQDASNDNRPETVDRDAQAAASQDAIDAAGIAYAEERRQRLHKTQATERATFEQHGDEMTDRHSATWGAAIHRHAVEMAEASAAVPTSYQPGTMAEAEQAAASGLSFVVGIGAGVLDSLASLISPTRRRGKQERSEPAKPKTRDAERREQQKRDQHQQEINAIMAEQAHERESYERRRATMLQDQQRAREHFEENYADPSALKQAFEIHARQAARKEAQQERERSGPDRDGPELKP